MGRVERRLSQKKQERDILRNARLPWQPMREVPRREWPADLERRVVRFWVNNKFTCIEYNPRITDYGPVRHLLIQRVTGERVSRWEPLQRVKNEVAGPDASAVELYPAECDVVNDCHMYHLWVLPRGYPLPGIGMGQTNEDTDG